MEKDTQRLIFTIGEETRPVILDCNNYKSSILASQIEKGLNLVEECANLCEQSRRKSNELFSDAYENRIISFIGERGSGKSSCMYSVMNIIRTANDIFSDIYISQSIDPSFFDSSHNILEFVIGNLYEKFEQIQDKEISAEKAGQICQLRRAFQQVKCDLRFIEEKQYTEDSELEELSGLASGIKLRESIRQLVQIFLDCRGKTHMLVPIDDIDLNTRQAYIMAEQIRKYLIMPEIILCIACKVDQLFDAVKLVNIKEYEPLLKNEQMSADDISVMTETYINKFLPMHFRIFMPVFEDYASRELAIGKGKDTRDFISVKSAVPTLIYEKTHYLFFNSKGQNSLIIPTRLRDLRSLIRMLYEMTDNYGNNREDFLNYLVNVWSTCLNTRNRKFVQAMAGWKEPSLINHAIISFLKKSYNLQNSSNPSEEDWNIILSDNCKRYNVSLGDVMAVVSNIGNTFVDIETRRLLFFIKALYSIRLFQYSHEAVSQIEKTDEPGLKHNRLNGITNLQQLVGGRYFNLSGSLFLAPESSGRSRERGVLNGDSIRDLLNEIKRNIPEDAGNIEDEGIVKKIQTAEFLMFISSYYIYTRNPVTGPAITEERGASYRERNNVYYDRDLSKVKNICYEITAPFFNLLDIRRTYNRFDGEFFDKVACKCKVSLYHQLTDSRNGQCEKVDAFRQKIAIHNLEIYEDLYQDMLSYRYNTEGTSLTNYFRLFFQRISKYSINTYEKSGNNEYGKIDFSPFSVLEKYLSGMPGEFEKYLLPYEIKKEENQAESNLFNIVNKERMYGKEIKDAIPDSLKVDKDAFDEKFNSQFPYLDKLLARSTITKRLRILIKEGVLRKSIM